MSYETSIVIKNSCQKAKRLFLEPWGEEFQIDSGKAFEIRAKADQAGNFEVEFGENEIVVFGWASSTVKIFCESKEIGAGSFERGKVPIVPEGQTVSTFLSFMFDKNEN